MQFALGAPCAFVQSKLAPLLLPQVGCVFPLMFPSGKCALFQNACVKFFFFVLPTCPTMVFVQCLVICVSIGRDTEPLPGVGAPHADECTCGSCAGLWPRRVPSWKSQNEQAYQSQIFFLFCFETVIRRVTDRHGRFMRVSAQCWQNVCLEGTVTDLHYFVAGLDLHLL